jgi:glycosyltransferase involved in cell wall biosynthesis
MTKNIIFQVSIVIPIFNEEKNIENLINQIYIQLKGKYIFELICVNDGSTDKSLNVLKKIKKKKKIKVITFNKNYGQTASLMAGFKYATGKIIVTIDADLQNDPSDIPKIIEELKKNKNKYDVISGWRYKRKDPFLRTIASKIANKIIRKISNIEINDFGCSLKAYKREIIKKISIYGEAHRLIIYYAHIIGARIGEIKVLHNKRKYGESKYGMGRIIKIILDIFIIKFFEQYISKPIYVFGTLGLFQLSISIIVLFLALFLKIYYNTSLIQTPLPLLSVMFFLSGITCLLMGLLGEILIRIYLTNKNNKNFYTKK